jgi:hypothetical protein
MMAMTTNNSIKVNAHALRLALAAQNARGIPAGRTRTAPKSEESPGGRHVLIFISKALVLSSCF